jgi:hypothetical protein
MRSCHRDHPTCREPILPSPYRRSPLLIRSHRQICRGRGPCLPTLRRRYRRRRELAILPIRSGRRLLPVRSFLLGLSELLRRILEISQLAQKILSEVGPTVAKVHIVGVLPDIERQ